jgi:hypothetical protein
VSNVLPINEPVFRKYGCTKEDQKSLAFWRTEGGWCSACGGYGDDKPGRAIVHVGVRDKASIGFCAECVAGLSGALAESAPTGSKAP